MCHGDADQMVSHKDGKDSAEFLRTELGFKDAKFETFEGMGHEACQEEMDCVVAWLKERFPTGEVGKGGGGAAAL